MICAKELFLFSLVNRSLWFKNTPEISHIKEQQETPGIPNPTNKDEDKPKIAKKWWISIYFVTAFGSNIVNLITKISTIRYAIENKSVIIKPLYD